MPAYVKLILSNEFPRTQVTTRLTAGQRALLRSVSQSRGAAELFENQFLDLFQIRRCQENLEPSPQHPGCIYGEMNMCLRPCQQVVTREEYLSEVARVEEFLTGDGAALLSVTTAARERLSEEMDFEAAARQHKRLERIQEVLALRDDLVCDMEHLYGVAVAPSTAPGSVLLWFVCQGAWHVPCVFTLDSQVSLDARLREIVAGYSCRRRRWRRSRNIWRCWRDGITRPGATASGSDSGGWMRCRTGNWSGRSPARGRKRNRPQPRPQKKNSPPT